MVVFVTELVKLDKTRLAKAWRKLGNSVGDLTKLGRQPKKSSNECGQQIS
jgi:hypothetical protein